MSASHCTHGNTMSSIHPAAEPSMKGDTSVKCSGASRRGHQQCIAVQYESTGLLHGSQSQQKPGAFQMSHAMHGQGCPAHALMHCMTGRQGRRWRSSRCPSRATL